MAGFSIVSFLANANSTIQRASDDHLRGRVMSIYSMLFLGMTPAGSLIIGFVSERTSTPFALMGSACLCLMASVFFIIKTKRLGL